MAHHEIVVQHAPRLTAVEAASLVRSRYGVEGYLSILPSERDQNFRIDGLDGTARVLKIANAAEREEVLDLQDAALAHLAAAGLDVPRVVPDLAGSLVGRVRTAAGTEHMLRLLTWVPGQPLATVRFHAKTLLESLGRRLGEMDAALSRFTHPAMARPLPWDLGRTPWIRDELGRFADADHRGLVERVLARFEGE